MLSPITAVFQPNISSTSNTLSEKSRAREPFSRSRRLATIVRGRKPTIFSRSSSMQEYPIPSDSLNLEHQNSRQQVSERKIALDFIQRSMFAPNDLSTLMFRVIIVRHLSLQRLNEARTMVAVKGSCVQDTKWKSYTLLLTMVVQPNTISIVDAKWHIRNKVKRRKRALLVRKFRNKLKASAPKLGGSRCNPEATLPVEIMPFGDRDLLGFKMANLYYTTLDTTPWLMPLLYAPQCNRTFNGLALAPEALTPFWNGPFSMAVTSIDGIVVWHPTASSEQSRLHVEVLGTVVLMYQAHCGRQRFRHFLVLQPRVCPPRGHERPLSIREENLDIYWDLRLSRQPPTLYNAENASAPSAADNNGSRYSPRSCELVAANFVQSFYARMAEKPEHMFCFYDDAASFIINGVCFESIEKIRAHCLSLFNTFNRENIYLQTYRSFWVGNRIQVLVSGTFNFKSRDKVSRNVTDSSCPVVPNLAVRRNDQFPDKKKSKIIRTDNQKHLINPPNPNERELEKNTCKDVEKYKNVTFVEGKENDGVEGGNLNIEGGYKQEESISFFESFILALKPASGENFFIISNVLKITQRGEEVILKHISDQPN